MDIHIRCSKCGKHLAVDEKTVGMIINCPDCSTALRVPLNHEKQICPHCRGETLVANNMNGQSIECSSCHKTFSVKSLNDPKHHACPFCYTAILVPDDFKGQFIDCPTCNQRYMIHRPNQDFQYRQNPSDGSTNGEQAEESPKGHYTKGIPQGLTANSLGRFRIVMLILAVILPIMAIGIYSVLPQSNQVVTIIAGAWLLSLSFINRKIRIVLPSIGLIWGVYRTDEGFTPYDITIIVISVLVGIWSYRLPVIGSGGLKITMKDEQYEYEERKRQRRIEAERRAMQSNGHPLLWSLIIIIALLLVFPGSRHWVVSAFRFDGQQTAEASARNAEKEQKSESGTHQTEQSGNENADPAKSRKNDMLWGAYLSSLTRIYATFSVMRDSINNGVDFITYSAQVTLLNKSLADFNSNSPDPRLFNDADYFSISSIINDRIRKTAAACNSALKLWQYRNIRYNADALDEYSKQYPYVDDAFNAIAMVYPSVESSKIPPSSPNDGWRYSLESVMTTVLHETSRQLEFVLNEYNKFIGEQ